MIKFKTQLKMKHGNYIQFELNGELVGSVKKDTGTDSKWELWLSESSLTFTIDDLNAITKEINRLNGVIS